LSATQIAETRKLTLGTIHGHFAKLISQDLLKLEEILSPERIARLKEVFEAYEKDTNLSTIKEQVGDEFTYGELKIGKISIG
jgi:hypothetical protein